MIKLNEAAKEKIKSDRQLFIEVQKTLNVTENSLYRFIKNDSNRLTEIDCLNTIVEFTGMPLSAFVDGKISKLICKQS